MDKQLRPFELLARYIGAAFAERGHKHWRGYSPRWQLALDRYIENKDGSLTLYFRYDNWYRPRVEIWNIKPKNLEGLKLSDPIPIETEQQDAISSVLENLDGNKTIKETYEAVYSKTTSQSDSFSHGFENSIETTFGASYGAVSGEVKTSFSASEQWEKVKGSEESVSKSLSREYECDPGVKLEVWAERSNQKLKRIATGKGEFQFSIVMNGADFGHGRKYDSLDNLVRVFEGRSPDNFPWAKWFRGHSTRPELIEKMQQVCKTEFSHEMIYDNAAKSIFHSNVIDTNPDNPYYVDPKEDGPEPGDD